MVLGKSELAKRVTRAIRQLGVQCRRVDTPSAASGAIGDMTKGLVIVLPIPKLSVSTFARSLDS